MTGYSAKDIQRLEERETQVARLSHELARLRRSYNALYERNRRLENKIRETIVVGESFNSDGLYQLRQMVPSRARKTLTQLRRGRRS